MKTWEGFERHGNSTKELNINFRIEKKTVKSEIHMRKLNSMLQSKAKDE